LKKPQLYKKWKDFRQIFFASEGVTRSLSHIRTDSSSVSAFQYLPESPLGIFYFSEKGGVFLFALFAQIEDFFLPLSQSFLQSFEQFLYFSFFGT